MTIDLDHYTKELSTLPVPPRAGDSPCDNVETARLWKAFACLGYAAKSGRLDLAFGVSECQQGMAQPTVDLIKATNRVIRRVRDSSPWVIQGLECSLEEVLFLAASDASFDSMPRLGS